MSCTSCNINNFIVSNSYNVCVNCGLTTSVCNSGENDSFSSEIPALKKLVGSSKISKMIGWMEYTNEQKNEYKLKKYTRQFLSQFKFLQENVIGDVCEMTIKVMNAITVSDNSGPKRSNVKDGLIIVILYYALGHNTNKINFTQVELARIINIDIKYISKAEKIIIELVKCESNKSASICRESCIVEFFKGSIKNVISPLDYIMTSINKYSLVLPINSLDRTKKLINICQDNDILLDHTPLSVGAACFYYILKESSISVDLKLFSDMYSLSTVTITKTYGKLYSIKEKLNKAIDAF